MDARLKERLDRWHEQIERLKEAESLALQLEAQEKAFFAKLFLAAQGKSITEREYIAYATPEWEQFSKGVAQARAVANHERRLLELKIKAHEATYLEAKHEFEAVKKVG